MKMIFGFFLLLLMASHSWAFGEPVSVSQSYEDTSALPKTVKGTPIFNDCRSQFVYTTWLQTRYRAERITTVSRNAIITAFEDFDDLCVARGQAQSDQILTTDYWLAKFYFENVAFDQAIKHADRFIAQQSDFNGLTPEIRLIRLNIDVQQNNPEISQLLDTFIDSGISSEYKIQAFKLKQTLAERSKNWEAAIAVQKQLRSLGLNPTAYKLSLVQEAQYLLQLNKKDSAKAILQSLFQKAKANSENMNTGVNLIIKLELERLR